MTHGRGKSDSVIVAAEAGEQRREDWPRNRWSEGRRPKGMRTSKPRAGHRTGKACQRALGRIRQAAKQRKKERFTSLLHHINIDLLRLGVLRVEAERRARCRRTDVAGLPGRPRAQTRGPACASPEGGLPGIAITAAVHTEARWSTAPTRRGGP